MESISSRPFQSRKLSNNNNKYDDVLSGKRNKSNIINVEDYREIFGSRTSSCSSSSIPVLNLSTLNHDDVFSINNFRSSKPDYNDIFGCNNNNNHNHNHNNNKFDDDDAAANVVSYEHLYGPDKTARSPSSTTSQDLDDKSHDVLKQFNMSYNKIGPKSKDMSDVTKHVTQLYSTPGYTCFIDEPKMEAKKNKSSPVHVVESLSEDKKFSHKNEAHKNDYEDDVNSDASASAAALRKAIENAQESIRIAKESVGRKKKGLKSFSNRSCKNSIKVESGTEDISATSTSSSQGFSSFMDVEKLFGAKKVIDEINGKLSKSAHYSKNVIDECVILRSEAVDTEIGTSEASEFVHADQTNNVFVDDSVRFTNARDLVKELNNLHIFEKEVEYEKKESRGCKEEDVENIADSVERHEKENEDDERIEDTSEWLESENESKDDHTQEEETSEIHFDVFEIEMEIEEKEKSLDDTFDEEYDENSLGDDNVIEETGSIDDTVITQKVEDVTEAFSEIQVEETESMNEAYASEEEGLCETVLDDNEDQYEVKSEENDIQSETSSGSIHDVKTEVDEAIEETKSLEETNIQIPTQNEVGEIGPNKVSGKEDSRRIDEMTAKNNRLAVDRAIREARERAFVEARERAERERAAVEKATEEVRQRMMAEAVEKVAKASSDRTSTQSKLRAERAAVERATSEARQRALEKAMTQKSVSDLNSSESALRRKAKLDKHNRIMERAAKALAEKEKRDLLAQKEQAERNRLSENLDADIKRWSKGKEGNLRALLSTLQYILGPQSGWQPITMTEIVTSNAVKKAYRKATLCVHPDKLQQRGASIQHKYICEKVFDLLKAAWSRFNSEER